MKIGDVEIDCETLIAEILAEEKVNESKTQRMRRRVLAYCSETRAQGLQLSPQLLKIEEHYNVGLGGI